MTDREKEALKLIGKQFREFREFQKLSKRQVFEDTGISRNYLREFEDGERNAGLLQILKLANYYNAILDVNLTAY